MKKGQRIQALRRYMVAEPGYWSWEEEIIEGEIVSFCRDGSPVIKTSTERRVIIDCRCTILEIE
jgi:hypothetical protein